MARRSRWQRHAAIGCAALAASALAAMMLVTVIDVALRSAGGPPLRGAFEIVELLLACTFFLCLPAAFLRDEHIVVTLPGSPSRRAAGIRTALAVSIMSVMAWQAWLAAEDALVFGDVTADLAIPRLVYWLPVLIGLTGAAAAAFFAPMQEDGR